MKASEEGTSGYSLFSSQMSCVTVCCKGGWEGREIEEAGRLAQLQPLWNPRLGGSHVHCPQPPTDLDLWEGPAGPILVGREKS